MVTDRKKDSRKTRGKQGPEGSVPEPNKINASTPYDFAGKNLTPYGGLLPVITMLEKLGFHGLVEQTVTSKRIPRAMDLYRFVLGIVLGLYIGFPRLNQLRFIARDPILTGILKVTRLPVQSTFWRFVNTLHGNVARQMLSIMRTMRERVWAAANVKLDVVTIDTDTTVHTLYGRQMGGRKSYNPKNKGKKSYQPMLTFIAETREYIWGELHNGDRPTGKQIGDHIRNVCAALPRVDYAVEREIVIHDAVPAGRDRLVGTVATLARLGLTCYFVSLLAGVVIARRVSRGRRSAGSPHARVNCRNPIRDSTCGNRTSQE
jgi:Transposase DDE domain group 1